MSPQVRIAFMVVRCLAAALAFYATTKQPYNFYIFTRWIVFLTCCWGLWLGRKRLWPSFAPGYFVTGLLFNTIFPFHFTRAHWRSLAIHRPSNYSSRK